MTLALSQSDETRPFAQPQRCSRVWKERSEPLKNRGAQNWKKLKTFFFGLYILLKKTPPLTIFFVMHNLFSSGLMKFFPRPGGETWLTFCWRKLPSAILTNCAPPGPRRGQPPAQKNLPPICYFRGFSKSGAKRPVTHPQ